MREAAVGGLLVLVLDGVLTVALWLVLLGVGGPSSCGGLWGVWTFGAVKWAGLHAFTSSLTRGRGSVELRLLPLLLCLLPPVWESGRVLVGSSPSRGPSPDLTSPLLLRPACAALSWVLWEGLTRRMQQEGRGQEVWPLLRRMLLLFREDGLLLGGAFSSLLLAVLCDTAIPWYQGQLLDLLRSLETPADLGPSIGGLVLVSVGSAVFSSLRGGVFKVVLARLNRRLKLLLMERLLQQEVTFFQENKPGRLSARLHNDVDVMGRTLALHANAALRGALRVVLMVGVTVSVSPKLSLLSFMEVPLQGGLQGLYLRLRKDLKAQIQDCVAHQKEVVFQTVGSIHTVHSFRAQGEELQRHQEALERTTALRRRQSLYSSSFLLLQRLLSVGMKMMLLLQARSLLSSNQITAGNLLTFLLYLGPLKHSVKEILVSCGETASTVGVASHIFSFLDRRSQWSNEGELAPQELQGDLLLQDVTFSYPSSPHRAALQGVCARLRPGTLTALVGPSGSGKTTLVSLIKRLYQPEEGGLLLDGQPLHRYSHKYLQQKVALVSQNPVLFSGSLRYNVEYGLKDVPFEKVRKVAEKVGAQHLLSIMEGGGDSDVGERGVKVSEGERQLVSIIRALLREPTVLLLDEATSSLDTPTQTEVLQEVVSSGRTVLVVAHRLQTVESAHHILFMEDGAVVEEGTHTQLMARRGRYHRLKEELFSGEPQKKN